MSSTKSFYSQGQMIVPGYRLVRRLGNGFSGEVWAARGAGGTSVAVKVVELSKIGGRREFQSLRTIRNVRHPNLCEIHAFWVKDADGQLLEDGESEAIIPVDGSLALGELSDYSSDHDDSARTSEGPFVANRDDDGDDIFASGDVHATTAIPISQPKNHREVSQPNDSEQDQTDVAATEESGLAFDPNSTQAGGLSQDSASQSEKGRGSGSIDASSSGGLSTSAALRKSAARRASAEQLIIVMSLGDQTLHDRLIEVRAEQGLDRKNKKHRKLPCGLEARESIRYIRAAALAIDLLMQKHDIMHGDIKPQNILLVGGEAQVCDFGLADKVQADIQPTQHPFVSPAYGPPEVLEKATYSKSADQYALAVTYYELRTGVLPFNASSRTAILAAKKHEKFDMDLLSPAERVVLRRAMRADPMSRYPTCTEFTNELALAAGVDAKPGRSWKWAAASVVLAILIGTAAVIWFQPDDSQRIRQTHEQAVALLKSDASKNEYASPLNPLRKGLELLTDNYPGDEHEAASEYQRTALETAAALTRKMSEALASANQNEEGRLIDESLFLNDLRMIHAVVAPAGRGLVKFEDPIADRLRNELDLIRLTLYHFDAEFDDDRDANNPVTPDSLADLRGRIRQRLDDGTIVGDDRPAASVLLALSREPLAASITRPALNDIARAEIETREKSNAPIAKWLQEQWLETREGEQSDDEDTAGDQGFIRILAAAYQDGSLSPEDRDLVAITWPEISREAEAGEMQELFLRQNWDGFVNRVQSDFQAGKFESLDQGSLRQRWERLIQLSLALNQAKLGISGLPPILEKLDDQVSQSKPTKPVIVRGVADWIGELARRVMESPHERLNPDQVERFFQVSQALCQRGEQPLPDDVHRLVLLSDLQAGGDTVVRDEHAFSRNKLLGKDDPLAILMELERQALDGQNLGKIQTDEWVKKFGVPRPSGLTNPFGTIFKQHMMSIIQWHRGNTETAIQKWCQMLNRPFNSIQALGPARAGWIADTAIDYIFRELKAGENTFFLRPSNELSINSSLIERIAKWHDAASVVAEDSARSKSLKWLGFAAEAFDADRKWRPRATTRAELDDEVDRILAYPTPASLSSTERLIVRLARAANADSDLPSLIARMELVVLILDDAGEQRAESKKWIDALIAPTLFAWFAQTGRDLPPLRRDPTKSIGWRLPENVSEATLKRLAEHTLPCGEKSFLGDRLRDLAKSESIAGEPLHFEIMEFCHAILAQDDPEKNWLEAAGELMDGVAEMNSNWTSEQLSQLRLYLDRARRTKASEREVEIKDAFADYFQARSVDDVPKMESAAEKLNEVIETGRESRPTVEFYNACWRHANLLVGLADRQAKGDKKATLLQAYRNAELATELIRDLPRRTVSNHAWLAKGNAAEDLAYFCSWNDRAERQRYFDEAIAAFENAKNKTTVFQAGEGKFSLKPQYSIARCLYRSYEKDKTRQADLERAESILSGLSPDELNGSTSDQIEYFVWLSIIQSGLNKRADAIQNASRARDLARDALPNSIDLLNETRYHYASLRSQEESPEIRLEVKELLDSIALDDSPKTAWKAFKLTTEILHTTGEDKKLNELVLRSPSKLWATGWNTDGDQLLGHAAKLAFWIRLAAQEGILNQGRPLVSETDANQTIAKLQADVDVLVEGNTLSSESKLYRRLMGLYGQRTGGFAEWLPGYLDVLSLGAEPTKALSEAFNDARRLLLNSMTICITLPEDPAEMDAAVQALTSELKNVSAEDFKALRNQLETLKNEVGLDQEQQADYESVIGIFAP